MAPSRTRAFPRFPRSRAGGRPAGPSGWAGRLLLAAAVLALVAPCGVAAARAHPSASVDVLAIVQSKDVTWNSTFTISMELANTSQVKFVYFTFCQLTSPVCYAPIIMTSEGSGWFAGTTKPMTSYPGMKPGVVAGYNITVELNDSTNFTEPRLPNAFSNLTIATSVSGEYMFQMSVRNLVWILSGTVSDAATGQAVAGATVALSPGTNSTVTNSTGGYAFPSVTNGTYQLRVTHPGYDVSSAQVVVLNQDALKDFALTNSSAGTTGNPPSSSGTAGVGATTYVLVGGLVAAGVIGAGVAVWARRRSGARP